MKIVIVTNILTPYRIAFYKEFDQQLKDQNGELKVFVLTDNLPLRPWRYEDLKQSFTVLVPGKKIFIRGEDYLFNIQINSLLKGIGPDVVVISGSWTYPTLWQIILKKQRNIRYFFWTESHNHRATKVGTSNVCILWLKKMFYRNFDGYCLPGKFANETVDHLIGKQGLRIKLPNLVDESFYIKALKMRNDKNLLRDKYSLSQEKIIFVCPARLIAIKGIDLFLKNSVSFSNITRILFLIAGEGPERVSIERIADQYHLDVKLMGYCNQDTIRELYALSDVFWLPSLQDANPLTSIEASFAGLPLLVSMYTGNSPELVEDCVNGVLFDTVDEDSVKRALEFVISSGSEWQNMAGKRSYEIAMENFCCKTETKKILEQFKSCRRSVSFCCNDDRGSPLQLS